MKIIERLKELLAKASGGKWDISNVWDHKEIVSGEKRDPIMFQAGNHDYPAMTEEDACLIVAAINALPALLEVAKASSDYRSAVKQRYIDQAEWGAAGYTISQDELMRRSDRMDVALAKLREIKP